MVKKTKAKKAAKRAAKTTKRAAKKTVAKKATKRAAKTTKRRVTSKKTAKSAKNVEVYKLAQEVPEDKYFILANGKPVKHVKELAEVLEHLEDHVFDHHVNPEQNDFHLWVKEVFDDMQLAKKMLGISDKKKLQLAIYKHAAEKAFKK